MTAQHARDAQRALLVVYALYGIGFGLVLLASAALAGLSMAIIGVAHIAFGAFATLLCFKAQPATRAKFVALVATRAIALFWGIAVTAQVSVEDPFVALILGTFYLPLPLAGIGILCRPTIRRLD